MGRNDYQLMGLKYIVPSRFRHNSLSGVGMEHMRLYFCGAA